MQGRGVEGPFQPAVRRQAVDGGFPVATETPRPTPSIARRLGGVGFRHGSYGEKERRIANAGERYYFVKTEAPITRRQASATGTGTSPPTQQTGPAQSSGSDISVGISGSDSGGTSGRASESASGSDSGSSGSASVSVSSQASDITSNSDVSSSSSAVVISSSSAPSDISSSSSAQDVSSSSSADVSSISSSDPGSSFSNSFSSFSSSIGTPSNSPSLTPDISSSPPVTTPPPNATERGISTTIFSTVVLTNSDGSESTSVIAIPTVLPYPSTSPSSASKRSIIIGASIGGAALLIIIASLLIFLKRSEKVRLNYKKLRVFGRRRQNLLDDEDDDWLENDHDGPGPATGFRGHGLGGGSFGTSSLAYTDNPRSRPVSAASSTRYRGTGGGMGTRDGNISGHTTPFDVERMLSESPVRPAPSPSPYILGMRATGSGSIFQEQGVWPPPSEKSRLIDPLVAGSEQVELGNIVDHVMGGASNPASQAQTPTAGPIHGRQPSAQASIGATTTRETSSRYAHSTMSSYGSGSISQYPPTQNISVNTRHSVQNAPPSAALKEQWEAARAQSPDSVLYDLSGTGGTLAVVNADPTTPTEGPQQSPPIPRLPPPYSSTTDVGGAKGGAQGTAGARRQDSAGDGGGQSTNWLERHPRESLDFHAI